MTLNLAPEQELASVFRAARKTTQADVDRLTSAHDADDLTAIERLSIEIEAH